MSTHASLISFEDPSIRNHLTLPELEEVVVQDILDRYGVLHKNTQKRDGITLDPGGMCYFGDHANYVEFTYNGMKFRCQDIHVPGVLASIRARQGEMNTEKGKLVRLYFPYYVLVLPASWLWNLCQYLTIHEEEAGEAIANLQEALRNGPKEKK